MSAAAEDLAYGDDFLRSVLDRVKTVAMVGAKDDWNSAPYFVMKYLQKKGYRVIPVNPKLAGGDLLGERVYAALEEAPGPFEMVDVFRNSAAAGGVVDDALRLKEEKGVQVVWMQLGVQNHEAAARGAEGGLDIVMNRCPKIEYARLNGEIGWQGFNSGVLSSKLRRR